MVNWWVFIKNLNDHSVSNFVKRTLTGVILIGGITGSVMLGVYWFLFLCFVINTIAVLEFYRLFQVDKNKVRQVLGVLLSSLTFLVSCLFLYDNLEWEIILVCIPLVSVIFIAELYFQSEAPFSNLGFIFLAIPFITLPLILFFACSISSNNGQYQPEIILGYFFLLWAHDSGAYVCGSFFGERPLFMRISPNKTWEGSAGGALLTFVVVYINYAFMEVVPLFGWMIIGFCVVVMGTFGDFVKSMMKRSVHVKDSGTILPGHGGVLDRFDSLIGSAPYVFIYLSLLNH